MLLVMQIHCYAPPLIGGGIKRYFCLTSVCLSDVWLTSVSLSVAYIGFKSRTERPRKTEIGTMVAHVTRHSDTTFKVQRSRSQGRFLADVLARQAAAAVGVGTCWP